jgi:alpha-tubulin suppressor-like RCC1 family protein
MDHLSKPHRPFNPVPDFSAARPSKNRPLLAGVAFTIFSIVCPCLHSQAPTPNPYPDWTVYGPVPVNGQTLSLSASWSHAGAITHLKLGSVEFIDNIDHGRQIQSSIQLSDKGEYYNPNEAGTLDDEDHPWSTSDLLGVSIPSSNRLMTTVDMAYWFTQTSQDLPANLRPLAVPYANAAPNGQFTQFWLQKDVTIGPAGLPGNVIDYLCTFQPSTVTPPLAVSSTIASVPAVYLRYPQFSEAYSYDLATRALLRHQDTSGADDMLKVMKWPNSPIGAVALSVYNSENLQPYGRDGADSFGWWLDSGFYPNTFINPSHYAAGGLPVSYRAYLVVGNPGEVTTSLDALDLKFASLDPDVFNWREYLRLNNLPLTWTRADARNHWLNTGVPNGYAGSYHFALGRYRNLNSDLWGRSNQSVIEHFIQYGRKEGRSTSPRAEGGLQHTLVRSPEQDFVPVRVSGGNSSGQLGNGTTTGTASPIRLPNFGTGQRPVDVASGDFTSLAVLADGTVWMWGSNSMGARGNGTSGGNQLTPVQVPNLPPIVVPSTKDRHVVAAGQNAYAVVDYNGCVWTWGYGGNGQLGRGNANTYFTPGKVQKVGGGDLTGIVSIAVDGGNMMAALDIDEHVWTWGYNGYGALGDNTTTTRYSAGKAQMLGGDQLAGITQLVVGGSFCLALQRNGVIWAWGQNSYGQLGDTTFTTRTGAVTVNIPLYEHQIDKIAAGSYHGVAHSDYDGRIYVWGYNGYGALGLPPGYPISNTTPVGLPLCSDAGPPAYCDATTNITDLGAGSFFTFLIRANAWDRKGFATGDNQAGQLGVNNYTTQTRPVLTSF